MKNHGYRCNRWGYFFRKITCRWWFFWARNRGSISCCLCLGWHRWVLWGLTSFSLLVWGRSWSGRSYSAAARARRAKCLLNLALHAQIRFSFRWPNWLVCGHQGPAWATSCLRSAIPMKGTESSSEIIFDLRYSLKSAGSKILYSFPIMICLKNNIKSYATIVDYYLEKERSTVWMYLDNFGLVLREG